MGSKPTEEIFVIHPPRSALKLGQARGAALTPRFAGRRVTRDGATLIETRLKNREARPADYCWGTVEVGAPFVAFPPIRLLPKETTAPP